MYYTSRFTLHKLFFDHPHIVGIDRLFSPTSVSIFLIVCVTIFSPFCHFAVSVLCSRDISETRCIDTRSIRTYSMKRMLYKNPDTLCSHQAINLHAVSTANWHQLNNIYICECMWMWTRVSVLVDNSRAWMRVHFSTVIPKCLHSPFITIDFHCANKAHGCLISTRT